MDHSEKLKHLEDSREQRRLGGTVIYPVANQQGCAMAPFAFAQAAEPVAPKAQLRLCARARDNEQGGQL